MSDGERDFWQRRYETQHRKVHAMEDEIARLRAIIGDLYTQRGQEPAELRRAIRQAFGAANRGGPS